jgi:hypothetical protein
MKPIKHILYSLFVAVLFLSSCDISKNKDVKPETSVKIYNNDNFSDEFIPIDIAQTSSEEYIFLAKTRIPLSDFYGVYILKADKDGNYISQSRPDEKYVNPVSMITLNGNHYFFCMNSTSLQTSLMKIDGEGNAVEIASLEETYPLAASASAAGGFILLSYNREDLTSTLTETDITGNVLNKTSFETSYGDLDAEPMILDHLRGTGKTIPFFCGYADNNRFYFNGLFRYMTSLSYYNRSGDANAAVIQGYQKDLAVAAICQAGNKTALAKNEYGNIYFTPSASLTTSPGSISSVSDIAGFPMLELIKDAKVQIKVVKVNGRDYFVLASETKGKQIILYLYDKESGVLKGSRKLGYTNPYEFASFTTTKSNGIAVTGTTYIAGRFSRICLFLLSENDLKEIVNPVKE